MKIEKKVLDMSLAGIFTAVIIAMSVVPFLGYIPLGFMNATIIHVPVIIGALLLGPKYGAGETGGQRQPGTGDGAFVPDHEEPVVRR